MEFRALRPDEIECRVQQVTQKGVMLLLYKDARCDMAVLDETVGALGWQRKHQLINNKEFCTVSIRDATIGEWIEKQDCGTESNTEKAKGESSDALKRACFSWGIGRELYTKIFIFIAVETIEKKDAKGYKKYEMKDRFAKFTVSKIETDNKAKKILHLEIDNKYNKTIFVWDNENPPKYEDMQEVAEQSNTKEKLTTTEKLITIAQRELLFNKAKQNAQTVRQAMKTNGYKHDGSTSEILAKDVEKILYEIDIINAEIDNELLDVIIEAQLTTNETQEVKK